MVDCNTHQVTDSLRVGGDYILCDTTLGKAYCSDVYQDAVHILDTRADTLIKTISLGRYPEFLCWNRTNSRVYINDFMDNVVYVIRDTSTGISERAAGATTRPWAVTTVTRGRFFYLGPGPGALVDACGRIAAALKPGHNDICALTPGVYAVVAADVRYKQKVVKVQ